MPLLIGWWIGGFKVENIYITALRKSFPNFERENRVWFWALTTVFLLHIVSGGGFAWISFIIWIGAIFLQHRTAYITQLNELQAEAKAEANRIEVERQKRAEVEALRQKAEQEQKAREAQIAREKAEQIRKQNEAARAESEDNRARMLAIHMANAQRANEERFRAFEESAANARMGKPRND